VVSAPDEVEPEHPPAPPQRFENPYDPIDPATTGGESTPDSTTPRKRTLGEILAGAASRFTRGRGKAKEAPADAKASVEPEHHLNGTAEPVRADTAPTELVTPKLNGAVKPLNGAARPPAGKVGPKPIASSMPHIKNKDSNEIADPDEE